MARKIFQALGVLGARPEPWAFVLALGVFGSGASVFPHWGDALEFTASAPILGVPHPTGYPLQALFAKLAAEVPVSSLARRMNLLSAGWMALASALMASCLWRLAAPRGSQAERFGSLAWFVAVGVPGCALFGPTGLELGSTAEIYAFHLAFHFALLRLAVELGVRSAFPEENRRARPGSGRLLALGGLVSGLSMTHHRLAVFPMGALGLAAGLFLWRTSPGWRAALRRTLAPAMFFALGLAPVLVLPIRASADPLLNWGAPDSPGRLLWMVRGGDFVKERFLSFRPGMPLDWRDPEARQAYFQARTELVREWAEAQLMPATFRETPAPGWAAAILGAFALAGLWAVREKGLATLWALLLACGGVLALVYLYNIPDPEGYLLSAWATLWLFAGAGAARLLGLGERFLAGRPVRFAWVGLLALPLVLWRCDAAEPRLAMIESGVPPELAARGGALAETYANRLLDALPPNAVLLTSGDNDIYGAWFAQFGSRHRLDVLPVGANFLKEEWYARQLAAHPAALKAGIETGGGTPSGTFAIQEYARRIVERVVRPALREGRPVFLIPENDLVRGVLERELLLAPVGELLTPDEERAIRFLYSAGRVPKSLYHVRSAGALP